MQHPTLKTATALASSEKAKITVVLCGILRSSNLVEFSALIAEKVTLARKALSSQTWICVTSVH